MCMYVLCVCIYVYTYMYICNYMFRYVCPHMAAHVCTHTYIHKYIHAVRSVWLVASMQKLVCFVLSLRKGYGYRGKSRKFRKSAMK